MEKKTFSFLRGLSEAWLGKISLGFKARKPWEEVANQCAYFFFGKSGYMWTDEYLETYLGKGIEKPKFPMTHNKAFDFVAIICPYLFWQYPHRAIRSHDPLEIPPEALGDPNDPQVMALYESLSAQQSQDDAQTDARNKVVQKYLSYSMREQPGGLWTHARMSITDAAVRGRGLLVPRTYTPPHSTRRLTGLFHHPVLDFVVDPDAESPDLSDATWVALRHVTPTWEVERRFGWEEGSLQGRGSYESSDSLATLRDDGSRLKRVNGQTHDLMVWYELFSMCGVGSRLQGMLGKFDKSLHQSFEEVVGDYAYLCVAENVGDLLNAPSHRMEKASDDDVLEMFRWPLESWRDGRFPVALLDFYSLACRQQDGINVGSWPVPPIAPAMGWLTALNILMSAFMDQAYENRKLIIGVLESAATNVKKALKGPQNPAIIEINDTVHKSLSEVIAYLQRPESNFDIVRAIEYCKHGFEESSGLTPHQYVQSETQSRTAEDVRSKEERSQVRQEDMSKRVAEWITEASNLEKSLAVREVASEDIRPLLGPLGAYIWDEHIKTLDDETLWREMKATVEASDIRKPSKARETANLQQVMDRLLPVFQQYAAATGDSEPINSFIESLGDSIELNTRRWHLGPWRPQPDEQAMLQQQQETELAQMQAQGEQQKAQDEAQKQQQQFQWDAATHQQKLQQSDDVHRQALVHDRVKFIQSLLQSEAQSEQKLDAAEAKQESNGEK